MNYSFGRSIGSTTSPTPYSSSKSRYPKASVSSSNRSLRSISRGTTVPLNRLRDQVRYWRIGPPQERYSSSSRSNERTTSSHDTPLNSLPRNRNIITSTSCVLRSYLKLLSIYADRMWFVLLGTSPASCCLWYPPIQSPTRVLSRAKGRSFLLCWCR